MQSSLASSVNVKSQTISREGNFHFKQGTLLYEVKELLKISNIEFKREMIEKMSI
jgi:hypothetical protein